MGLYVVLFHHFAVMYNHSYGTTNQDVGHQTYNRTHRYGLCLKVITAHFGRKYLDYVLWTTMYKR